MFCSTVGRRVVSWETMAGSTMIMDVSCIERRGLWRSGSSDVSKGDGGLDCPLSMSMSRSEVGLVCDWGPVMKN